MNRSLSKIIFLTTERLRGEPFSDVLNKLEKSQFYSPDVLHEQQWNQVKALMEHAFKNVPFYKKKFIEIGAEPGDFKELKDFTRFPELTKEDLRVHYDDLIARDEKRLTSIAKTSGSTGLSLHFPKDRLTTATQRAAMQRGHRWHGVDIGAKEGRLWGIPVNFKERMIIRLTDMLLNRFREREYNLFPDTLDHFFRLLWRQRPDYLMGYTSMVYQFALFCRERKLPAHELGLKMVKCTSETIHEYEKETIRDVFNCPAVSEYGAAETGLIAFECPHGNHHLMSDCVMTEFKEVEDISLDNDLREMIVTVPTNFSFPIIRYKIGDLAAEKNEICSCGRSLPLIDRIVGRTSNIVITPSGRRFHSIVFYYIMKGLQGVRGGVRQFRVVQKSLSNLDIYVVKDDSFDEKSMDYLNRRFFETFGEEVMITYKFVDIIPREPSGKLRDFISELPNERYA